MEGGSDTFGGSKRELVSDLRYDTASGNKDGNGDSAKA
jgi:hypothetical protein